MGFTVTLSVPVLVVSWLEMAVTVAVVPIFTAGPVNTPLVSIVPMLAAHVTPVVKVPVPVTVAVHWLVCPDSMVVDVQVTVTAVMVEVLLPPPPPQAVMMSSADSARTRARERKPSPMKPYEHSAEAANDYLIGKQWG